MARHPADEPPAPPAADSAEPFGAGGAAAVRRLLGTLRPDSGQAATRPRGFRAGARPGARVFRAGNAEHRPLPDAAEWFPATRRPLAGGQRRRPPRPRRPVRQRPPLVARPHGSQQPPPGRADGADLPRLVRDLERGGEPAAAHDRPVEPVPRRLLRVLPGPGRERDQGPGDAAVAERQRESPSVTERELRPRADGAFHPGRRPPAHSGLHRERHSRGGQGADRLAQRLLVGARRSQLPLRSQPPQQRQQGDLLGSGLHLQRQPGRELELVRRASPLPRAPASRVLLRGQAVELTSSPSRPRPTPATPSSPSTPPAATASGRWSRRS